MGTTIYYFSGTGNSLKIARELAEKIEDSILIPIAKVWDLENLESTSKKIGFIGLGQMGEKNLKLFISFFNQ